MTRSGAPALGVQGLRKAFGSTVALAGVDIDVYPGSIHALIGLNGSGKSTLVKVLSGYYEADSGSVSVRSDMGATSSALAVVHQDLGLIPEMSVLKNLQLGRKLATRLGRIDARRERERARNALAPFGLESTLDTELRKLTRSEATIVAIARALDLCAQGCSVLVMDEPTSTLPISEINRLLSVMRDCAEQGIGILFISHQLREVLAVSDEVTVLRNGHVSWSGSTAEATLIGLVAHMTGDEIATGHRLVDRPILNVDKPASATPNDVLELPARGGLKARNLSGDVIKGVDLDVGVGEIVGIVGLLGSGVEELGALLAGRETPRNGVVELEGKSISAGGHRRIGFVPADRARRGVLPGLSARENLSISQPGRHVRHGRMSRRAELDQARYWLEDLMVEPPAPDASILTFSGGNQQKVLIGRWLSVRPSALIAEEPTQGVDVRAKAQILERISAHARAGLSVVLLSGEPEEVADICDRMLVLSDGQLVAEFSAPHSLGPILEAMHSEVGHSEAALSSENV